MPRPTPLLVALLLALCPALACTRAPAPPGEPSVAVVDPPLDGAAEPSPSQAEVPATDLLAATAPATRSNASAVERIRDEGLNRSQVMRTLSYLTDVIGPRLTGSPNLARANEWTRKQLESYGLVNARLEPWGPFGRGWSVERFSAQVVAPQHVALIGAPKAWSTGLDRPIVADVVYLDAKSERDFVKYRGKLKGAIVLVGQTRALQPRFEPLALRVSDTDLLKMANAEAGATPGTAPGLARSQTPSERRALLPEGLLRRVGAATQSTTTTRAAASRPTTASTQALARSTLKFLIDEGAAVMVTPSTQGDGGAFFVGSAAVPTTQPQGATTQPRAWDALPPSNVPQVALATEDYNRLIRMIELGEKLKIELDLRVRFHSADPMAQNTVAEIPGTDLKDEIVMVGAHLDSWHAGTGATDNAAGTAAVMEAVRIIRAAGLKPRRTIRVALWTGEEQGLLGSKAYVERHFGKWESSPTTAPATLPTVRPTTGPRAAASRPAARRFVPGPEHAKLSAYFNLDNGAGKIRGIYLQGNEAARPVFRRWLAPFADLGAETISARNTGGTDHVSFDGVGLPGFQFIQDPLEYWTRTHHSNQDTYDRVPAEDLKQASTIIAAFVYNAAMADEKLPRKPTTNPAR